MRVPWFAISILASPYSVRVIEAVQLSDICDSDPEIQGWSLYILRLRSSIEPTSHRIIRRTLLCAIFKLHTSPRLFSPLFELLVSSTIAIRHPLLNTLSLPWLYHPRCLC